MAGPTLVALTGFNLGTVSGVTEGISGTLLFDEQDNPGSQSLPSTTLPDGSTGPALRCNTAALDTNLAWNTFTLGAATRYLAETVWVRIDSGSGEFKACARTNLADFVLFRLTASRFIEVYDEEGDTVMATSSAQITYGQWFRLDYLADLGATTWTVDWTVDYGNGNGPIAESQGVSAGKTVSSIGWCYVGQGTRTATTMDVRFVDWSVSRTNTDYPLGSHRILLLLPDPSGTITLSGTAANWGTFTANGTIAAWDATTARNAIDEVPPTVGASADGLVQRITATSDYIEIPMTSISMDIGEIIAGVRMVACGWAASTGVADLGFWSWNGLVERELIPVSDREFDNTSAPAWACEMLNGDDVRTQARLNALAIRLGRSDDATSPSIGLHALYLEAAVGPGTLERIITVEDGLFTVDYQFDATNDGALAYRITSNDPARGATFEMVVTGTPVSVYVDPSDTRTEFVNGTAVDTVTDITLTPDPT